MPDPVPTRAQTLLAAGLLLLGVLVLGWLWGPEPDDTSPPDIALAPLSR